MMMKKEKNIKSEKIMGEREIKRALERIARQIIEENKGLDDVVMVGILSNGYPLAKRLVEIMKKAEKVKVPIGKLDIALYRDDLIEKAGKVTIRESSIPFDITDKKIVLVDDVLFHGRTIRAALDGMIDYGRPKEIQLAVLVDRGYRELPIQADYVGIKIKTKKQEEVRVEINDGREAVYLVT